MKKFGVLLFIALFSLYSCKQKKQEAKKDSFTINGNIKGITAPYVYFNWSGIQNRQPDSAAVKDGKFTFTGKVSNPEMAMIFLKNRKGGFRFYLENADINVTGDSISNVKITGSQSQKVFEEYQASLKSITDQRSKVIKQYMAAKKSNDQAKLKDAQKQLEALGTKREGITKKFIGTHPDSFLSLDLLQQVSYGSSYKELNTLYTGLDTTLQNSEKGKAFAKQLAIRQKTAIGKTAPDFTLNNVDGKPVSLSDFKGKYVLVDFWASWCGPCRAENPNVVKAYNQYKDKNFTILGVSLDSKADNWKKAIKDDGLTWTHVSDLKGWENAAAAKYGVRAIPANFLINPEGVIIGHNLRGEALEKKLAEVLK